MKFFSRILFPAMRPGVLGLLMLTGLISGSAYGLSGSDIHIADVSPSSFTVIWTEASEADGSLQLFGDALGTHPVTDAIINVQFTESGDANLVSQATSNGVLRIRVSGLTPATDYFFSLTSTPIVSGVAETYPASGPLLRVITQQISSVVSNETVGITVLQTDGTTAASGSVLLAKVTDSSYPVSHMIGDGTISSLGLINLSNLYGNDSINREINGGETLELTVLGGTLGRVSSLVVAPVNERKGALEILVPGSLQLLKGGDSDRDGMPDWYEIEHGLNVNIDDANENADTDTLTNIQEYQLGTDPNSSDSDGDGWNDDREINIEGTSAIEEDTDGDGINDNEESIHETDPLDSDSDNDGSNDGDELIAKTDPNDVNSFPFVDLDKDGVGDHIDNCPGIPNTGQENLDNDNEGDACDNDMDGDGIANADDNAPHIPNSEQKDSDLDGLGDVVDNCPANYNPEQTNSDSDSSGDDCDIDDDNDGVNDYMPSVVPSDAPFKLRQVLGFVGSRIELNASLDASIGVFKFNPNAPENDRLILLGTLQLANFEFVSEILQGNDLTDQGWLFIQPDYYNCKCINTKQNDTFTLLTDAGEVTVHMPASRMFDLAGSLFISTDGSSYDRYFVDIERLSTLVQSSKENIPLDNCQLTFNPDQSDIDNDGLGDVCDISLDDLDGDGILNSIDNCPNMHNISQTDTDNDGVGNACDIDDDGDNLLDSDEAIHGTDPLKIDSDGDGIADGEEDHDFDGVSNLIEISLGEDPLVPEGRYSVGLNFLHLPFSVASGTTAFTLISAMGGEAFVSKLQRLNPLDNSVQTAEYIGGVLSGEDFPVISGEGYMLLANQGFNRIYSNTVSCPSVTLTPGHNLIGFSCLPGAFSAYDLLEHLGGDTVISSVQRLNKLNGLFETATFLNGSPVGVDFPISNTEAYLVYAKTSRSVSSPANFTIVDITSHLDGAVVTSSQVTLSGNVNTSNTSVVVNGQVATVTGNNFSIDLDLPEGTHVLNVDVKNQNNLVSSQILSVTVAYPADITVQSHLDGTVVFGSEAVIFGVLDRPVSRVTVNGNEAILSGNKFRFGYYCSTFASYLCDYSSNGNNQRLNLHEGINTVTIEATTPAGIVSTQILTLNYQRLTIVTTLNPGASSGTFTVSIPEPVASNVSGVAIYVPDSGGAGGIFQTPFSGRIVPNGVMQRNGLEFTVPFEVEVQAAYSGSYAIDVNVAFEDSLSNTAFSVDMDLQIDVPVSHLPPLISVDTQADNETVKYLQAQVSGLVNAGTRLDSISVNGVSAITFDDRFSAGQVPLTEGASTVVVEATGENNKVATETVTLNVEPIEMTLAPGEKYFDKVTTRVPKEISQQINNYSLGNVRVLNAPKFIDKSYHSGDVVLDINETFTTGDLARMTHYFAVEISPYYSVNSGVYDVLMDWWYPSNHNLQIFLRVKVLESRDAPIISLNSHTNGETVPSSPAPVTIRVSNDSAAQVTINGIAATQTNSNLHLYTAVVDLTEGLNNLDVEALGINGLNSSTSYTLNLSSQPAPVVNITSHSDGDTLAVDPVNIIAATAAADGEEHTLFVNGLFRGSRVASGGQVSWSNIALDNVGANQIEIVLDGYITPVTSIYLNLLPAADPVINVTSHTQGETVTSAPVIIAGSIQNSFTSVTVNDIDTVVDGSNFSLEHVDLSNGLNTITIVAIGPGTHGATATTDLLLNYIDPLPPIEITIPAGSTRPLFHEFVTSADFWRRTRNLSMRIDESRPTNLSSSGGIILRRLSGNRMLAEQSLSVNGGSSAGNYSFPIILSAIDNSDDTIFEEVVDVNLTITEDLQVTQLDFLVNYQSIQLTAAQDQNTDWVEVIATGLPDFMTFDAESQSHFDTEYRWSFQHRIFADITAIEGFYSFDVTYNFRTYDQGQGSQLLHTEVRTITVEVISKPVAPTVSITSHGNGSAVNSSPVTIEGSVGDPNASVTVNSIPALVTVAGSSATFSADIDLVEGENLVQVQSMGATGFRSNAEITLNLDAGK